MDWLITKIGLFYIFIEPTCKEENVSSITIDFTFDVAFQYKVLVHKGVLVK